MWKSTARPRIAHERPPRKRAPEQLATRNDGNLAIGETDATLGLAAKKQREVGSELSHRRLARGGVINQLPEGVSNGAAEGIVTEALYGSGT